MIDRIKQTRLAQATTRLTNWAQSWLVPALLRRRIFGFAVVASLLAAIYWGVVASDRYVSEAHIIIEQTDLGSNRSVDLGSLLGATGGANRTDQLFLRDHLLSIDMLKKLDTKLNLRAHYSDWQRDPLSRMWFEDTPVEWFHDYYLSRVSVELDDYSGILVIKAQAYDPEMAYAITTMLVEEGEDFMNALSHSLAREQVAFLEKQVASMNDRTVQARQAVLEYQNQKGLASPQDTAENFVTIVNQLEGKLTDLQTRRSAMLGYLMPGSTNIVDLNMQIAAVERQIVREQGRLASPKGTTLNRTVEEFQRLQMNAEFIQDVYKTTLAALERGRVEATRMLKKVSILQSPSEPQYPLEPRRIYSTIVFILGALLIAGIAHLLAAIIRDHKD
jgi:capsular polysaccharide transport system permease protein